MGKDKNASAAAIVLRLVFACLHRSPTKENHSYQNNKRKLFEIFSEVRLLPDIFEDTLPVICSKTRISTNILASF